MSKITPKNMAEAIYKSISGKSGAELEKAIKNSVQLLAKKGMIGKSKEILNAIENISDKETGTVRVKVTTGKSIGNSEKKKIEDEIKERYKAKHVRSEFEEVAELLGGMRIEVRDEVIDTTYKTKLENLENFLKQ